MVAFCVTAGTIGLRFSEESNNCGCSILVGQVVGVFAISHMIASSYCNDALEPYKAGSNDIQCSKGTFPKYSYYESGAIKSIECVGAESSAKGEL